MNVAAHKIQRAIYVNRNGRYEIALPNYTPWGWFECDVFAVTKSGFFHEFEVKTSRADFKADAKKGMDKNYVGYECRFKSPARHPGIERRITKHELLDMGHPAGPKFFWFVTPIGILDVDEIPDFAGFMECTSDGRTLIRKKAPKLHSLKLNREVVDKCNDNLFHRIWSEQWKNLHLSMRLDYYSRGNSRGR